MPKPAVKDSKQKAPKAERDSVKAALKAHGWKDADVAVIDSAADRYEAAERIVEMQRRAKKASK
jgi:hypothetical protein